MGDRGTIDESQGGRSVDANLQRLQSRFESDPSDAAAFEALEEHHFLNSEWNDLLTLYERRLESPDLNPEEHPKQRARLVFRLAQVLEERCLQPDRAVEAYESVARLDPSYQPNASWSLGTMPEKEWKEVLDVIIKSIEEGT